MGFQSKNEQEIPDIQNAKSLNLFIRRSLDIIRSYITPSAFVQKVQEVGIQSRVTYRQILGGKRRFPETKIPFLARALDLTFQETTAAMDFAKGTINETRFTNPKYIAGPEEVLSNPLHTVVLNLCDLNQRMTMKQIVQCLSSFSSEDEIRDSVELLLNHQLLSIDRENCLHRISNSFRFSLPPGIKLDCAKKYIQKSLQLAKISYDLPLEDREYTAFTAKMRKEDMPKLKDLVRNFRKSVYNLSDESACDTVVQINLNAFIASSANSRDLV